ncbi:MAG: hypothetical protein E7618_07950 [Ruminococcaceae bacterium]|nr:hypothetical protein [Oscillospiraceae bacterium]
MIAEIAEIDVIVDRGGERLCESKLVVDIGGYGFFVIIINIGNDKPFTKRNRGKLAVLRLNILVVPNAENIEAGIVLGIGNAVAENQRVSAFRNVKENTIAHGKLSTVSCKGLAGRGLLAVEANIGVIEAGEGLIHNSDLATIFFYNLDGQIDTAIEFVFILSFMIARDLITDFEILEIDYIGFRRESRKGEKN